MGARVGGRAVDTRQFSALEFAAYRKLVLGADAESIQMRPTYTVIE